MTATAEVKEWKAPNRLEIPAGAAGYLKEKGLHPKWVAKGNLTSRMAEGWEVIPQNGAKTKLTNGSVNMDSCFHVRELILCGMPHAMVAQRNEYYADKNDRRISSIKRGSKMKQEAGAANLAANKRRGTSGESFVKETGSVTISRPGSPVDLEPMLDEKEIEGDLSSLEN